MMHYHDSRRGWGEQFQMLYIFYMSILFGDTGYSSINIIVFLFNTENANHTEWKYRFSQHHKISSSLEIQWEEITIKHVLVHGWEAVGNECHISAAIPHQACTWSISSFSCIPKSGLTFLHLLSEAAWRTWRRPLALSDWMIQWE